MTSTLMLLVLNEIGCLKIMLPRFDKQWVDEVIIVDGGSTDGSIEFARKLGYYVYVQKGKGVMAGFREGFELAKGDIVILMTPDGNMIPEKIPELIAKMEEGYDMVIVSRYKDGARSYDDSLISGFGNWLFTSLVNLLFRAHYTDVLGAYRAYRNDIFERLGLEIKSRPLMTRECIRIVKLGLKVTEIPGDELKRVCGKSYRGVIKNGLNELFIIIEEFFNIPSTFVDSFLKF